jgi:hypothetical protein
MDVQEVNNQVRKMSSIYEKANEVIAWLGSESGDSKNAFELLRLVNQMGVGKCLYEVDGPWPDDLLPSQKAIEGLVATVNLFACPYWMQCRAVQEVAFAKSVRFRCGFETLS